MHTVIKNSSKNMKLDSMFTSKIKKLLLCILAFTSMKLGVSAVTLLVSALRKIGWFEVWNSVTLYLNLQLENSRRRSSRKFFKAGGGGGLRSKRSLIRDAPSEYESTSAVSSVIVNTPWSACFRCKWNPFRQARETQASDYQFELYIAVTISLLIVNMVYF